jgi:hypothetical protein
MAESSQTEASWDWPQDLPGAWEKHDDHEPLPKRESLPKQEQQPKQETDPKDSSHSTRPAASSHQQQQQQQPRERHYRPRTCRICLETVLPTYAPPTDSLPGFLRPSPTVSYDSEEGGRLLRPCLCKGSQKYVHEQCLQAWRLQNPAAQRNYWQCPTCRYKYRLERMTWANYISSTSKSGLPKPLDPIY